MFSRWRHNFCVHLFAKLLHLIKVIVNLIFMLRQEWFNKALENNRGALAR